MISASKARGEASWLFIYTACRKPRRRPHCESAAGTDGVKAVWTESQACIFDGFPNRRLIESLRDRHQGAGHADGNDGAGLADHT